MPITASRKMRRMHARWMVDRVRIIDPTVSTDVNPTTLQPVTGRRSLWEGCGLVRQETVTRTPGEGRVFNDRVLQLKVPDEANPQTGQTVTILECRDASLVGRVGTVKEVTRDSVRSVRRCTIQLETIR